MIPENQNLPDAVLFANGNSFEFRVRADALSVNQVGGSEGADVDVSKLESESSEDDGQKNVELSGFNLNTGSISEEERKQNRKEASCGSGS